MCGRQGSTRAELIKQFYEVGLQGEETKFQYPTIKPHVMASLQELTGQKMTVQNVNERIVSNYYYSGMAT